MNLEQIVKETVAKFVAEKQGKDLTGDGKIDSKDYLKARSNAIEKAKGLDEDSINDFGDVAGYIIDLVVDEGIITPEEAESDEVINNALEISEKMFGGYGASGQGISTSDYNRAARALVASLGKSLNEEDDHEVSMAQSSLNSILRSAMELKAKIGSNEIDIPAWIQDHITNSENFIDQASQGYHEYNNGGEHGEMDEANLGHNEISKIEQEGRFWIVTYSTADGTKEKSFESEDEARKFYNGLDEVFKPKSSFEDYSIGDNVTVSGKKAKITNMKMDDESGERRARVRFEDGTTEEVSINSLDESQLEEDMGGIRQNLGQEVVQKYGYQLKPIFDKYKESNIEWSQILKQYGSNSPEFKEINDVNKKLSSGFKNAALNGAAIMLKAKGASDTQIRNYFSEYGYFEDWVSDFMDELMDELGESQQNENTMTTNEGRSAEDLKQIQLNMAQDHLENLKNSKYYGTKANEESIKKAEERIEKLSAELDALAEKSVNESFDEATVRRWQHYAGIK